MNRHLKYTEFIMRGPAAISCNKKQLCFASSILHCPFNQSLFGKVLVDKESLTDLHVVCTNIDSIVMYIQFYCSQGLSVLHNLCQRYSYSVKASVLPSGNLVEALKGCQHNLYLNMGTIIPFSHCFTCTQITCI